MSIHKSFSAKGKMKSHRNVLRRGERIVKMREMETWEEGRSVFALPKVRNIKPKKKVKKKEAAEAAAGTEAGAAAPEGGAPSASPAKS
jgi:small basic protein (TIGR04137 family)